MEDELDKILSETEKKPNPAESVPPEGGAKEEKKEEPKVEDDVLQKRREELANLERAKSEALAELQKIRSQKKQVKVEEDELPEIDLGDPSAKAWDKHVDGKVGPIAEEMEKERAEVRSIALKEFLEEHPGLAKNPSKLKDFMATYDRLKTSSERVKEAVKSDFSKAFGAVYGEDLMELARKQRIDQARADEIFSEPAISRGATTYSDEKNPNVSGKTKVTRSEYEFMKHKWGMSDDELNKLYTLG